MRNMLMLLVFSLGFNLTARGQLSDTSNTNNQIRGLKSTEIDTISVHDKKPTGRKITLQEAITIALKNNYQLKQADNNLSLAQKQILGAKADFLPSISGRLQGQRTKGQQFVQATVKFTNLTTNALSGGASASLPIFQGFRNIINLRQRNLNKEYQYANKQRTRETVIFNAASGFLQVVLNQQLLKISHQNQASAKDQLRQVKGQVQVGSKPRVDLYNQQSTVASNRVEVTKQENALSYSKTQLLSTLQLDPTKNYIFTAPDLNQLHTVPSRLNLDNLIRQALANRHDLKAQQFLIKRNKKDIGLQRANTYPSLSLVAGINTQYNDQYRIGPKRQTKVSFNDQFLDQNVNKFVGFTLDVPIFSNLNNRLDVQKAKINYQNSKLQYQHLKHNALEEVRQAYNDYRSYSEQLSSTKRALRSARKSYQTERERYKVGAGSLVEYSDANSQFVQTKANRAQAILRFIFQKKLLHYYTGNIDSHASLNK